jgi:hypothetical protein
MHEFEQFQGRAIGNSYVLGQMIALNEESAVYLTKSLEGLPAVAKLQFGELSGDRCNLDNWLAAAGFSHPNLIHVFEAGTTTLDSCTYNFIVMERADETLASVLAHRALSELEAREMFVPTLSALSYLHGKQLVHGSLHPSNVMAVGETLKLSSDNVLRVGQSLAVHPNPIYDCPEKQSSAAAQTWDSWSFGALLLESLTLRVPQALDDQKGLLELHTPFSDIARHTLLADPDQRWTVTEIAQALEGQNVTEYASNSKALIPELPIEAAPEPPARMHANPSSAFADSVPGPRRAGTKWLAPVIVFSIVLLLLLVWLGKPRASTRAQSVPTDAHAVMPTTAIVPSTVAPPVSDSPVRKLPQRAGKGHPQSGWYVVVATYAGKTDAEKRARAIVTRWPRFRARVFDPPIRDPHHLIVVGGPISQDEANALRTRARAAGFPRDIYIKRFPITM